ncbi:spore germination protein GerPB [Halobacillus amylolyticus]|uniref:Spore germination protein GerPB n=1 Tax=Halobacillus amylolyticus TaxID=2932259 RepID=A0ABY4HFW2_9BACI|nr:spore germination protein GerPB [Halobacillus amylolyticus]UOR13173.1 spore germination protein GerPB [Halobacillus amylolyticus]
MNLTIHQTISIRFLKIGSVANSSVVQIGSSGAIQAKADLYNTGGFTEAAEVPQPLEGQVTVPEPGPATLVPLSV